MKKKRLKSILAFLLVFCMAFGVQANIVSAQENDDSVVQKSSSDAVTDTENNTDVTDTESDTGDTTTTEEGGITTETEKGSSKLKRSIAPTNTEEDSDDGISPQSNDDTMSGTCGAEGNESNVTWKLEQNNQDSSNPTYTLTISGIGAMKDYGQDTDVPWNEKKSLITTVIFENGISKIGNNALKKSAIDTVIFGNGSTVNEIGMGAFQECTSLTSVTIPKSVITIKGKAFRDCSNLSNVVFEEGSNLKTLGGNAGNVNESKDTFVRCTALTSVQLPETVETIGYGCFDGCSNLTSVSIPNGVTYLGEASLRKTSITNFTVPTKVTHLYSHTLSGTKITELKIGNQVTQIDVSLCVGCENLRYVYIGTGVTQIPYWSFQNCSNLETVVFENVNSLSNYAFQGCSNLKVVVNNGLTDLTLVWGTYNNSSNPNYAWTFDPYYSVNANNRVITYLASKLATNQYNNYESNLLGTGKNKVGTAKHILAYTNGGVFKENQQFSGNMLAIPTKENYKFLGWYDNESFSGTSVNTSTAGKIYYAKWEEKGESTISITKNLDKTYDGKEVSISANDCTVTGNDRSITFSYQVKEGNDWKDLDSAPTNVGTYQVKAVVEENDTYKSAKSVWEEFTISKATPDYTAPTSLTAIVGQTLADVKLPAGFTWQDADTTSVGTAGTHTFKATYTPTDTENYNIVKDIEVTVKVYLEAEIINVAPTITAEDKVLTVGDTFKPLEGVTASDKEDRDLTSKITVESNTVDTSKAGTYEVTYKVTDSQGASVTKTITVTVKEKDVQKPTTDDNKKPSKTDTDKKPANTDKTTSNSPKTGDNANMTLWGALVILSGGLLAVVAGMRRKRKFEK